MPEAPVITSTETAPTESGDEGSTSEGSSIEPGDKPGDPSFKLTPHRGGVTFGRGALASGQGAMLLSELRRR
ncbi:hypothetical protein BJD99_04810 [Rhodococcus sp. 1163]|uniref:hypothetical protein n=1 Tax=unclassified Rhodococcus (in: high G+C Gram-positive bacteria) TaxID=192944 RepID=UPI000A00F5C4|nr:hypothetical protein [Rhodococcus sp. 1163]ORI19498.1 hypothetical protein BJD99_04810 [Rhodococcus sp. 1163]